MSNERTFYEAAVEIDPKEKNSVIVSNLVDYMKEHGLKFKDYGINLLDSTPFGELSGGSSVSFRKRRKINAEVVKYEKFNMIVIYSTKADSKNIERELGKKDLGNKGDPARPYCYAFSAEEFPAAVEILKLNPRNI